MGSLKVKDGTDGRERVAERSLYQEVVAVITHSATVPVERMGDEDLHLVFEIIEGPSKGLKVEQYVPLRCGNESLRIRGCVALQHLCRALGMEEQPTDFTALHGKPLVLWLSRKRGSEDRPTADYHPCGKSDCAAWERWAEGEAARSNAKSANLRSVIEYRN